MSLAPGARLGSHEIIGLLGAGGMGEVYRARDTRLNREVAIKVLPAAYASDPDRIARFHREAQAVAALNHTSIAGIYDLAEADPSTGSGQAAIHYLVLELIEGETLAERMRRGPVAVEEALVIAKQILEALEVAHEKGICHRDLKPANVKLTPDGAVKVLDFGLAKFLQGASPAGNLTHSPTLSLAGTFPGVIMGTAGYMSPEQAKGFEADQRSDIFSFGCILYELLTGRLAFEGETASEILAGVLKSDVDLTALPRNLNPRLVEVLRRCLEKNPKKRWHAAADVRNEIEAVMGRAIVIEEPAVVAASRSSWKLSLVLVTTALASAALAGYAAWTLKPEPPRPLARFVVSLPEGQAFSNPGRRVLALSPDGSNLVYVANNRLYLRPLAGFDAQAIPGSENSTGVLHPVFSPDGQFIAYRSNSDSTLKRIALSGGAPVTITPTQIIYGLSWDDDWIVFGQAGKGIMRVRPAGGVPEVIAAIEPGEIAEAPQLLPGGRAVMFSVRKTTEGWDKAQIVAQPIEGGERTVLVNGGADGRYLPTGHLAYALSGVVLAVPFDAARLAVTGGPVPLIEGVRRGAPVTSTGTAPATAQFVVSQTGILAYVPGPVSSNADQSDLALFDRKREVKPLKLPPGPYRAPRASRDGQWIAFENSDEKTAFVSLYEISGRIAMRRLTFEGNSRAPVWSPDGEWVAFQLDRDGDVAIFRTRADGSGTAERLTKPESGTTHTPQSWSSDGEHLLFSAEQTTGTAGVAAPELWILTMKDRKVSRFGDVSAREAVFSPDGKWVAYQTRGSSGSVVFVEPFPRTNAKYLVPQPGGHPIWSPQGDELILNTGPSTSQAIGVSTTPRFSFATPVDHPRGGRTEANPSISRRQSDMMPNGQLIGILTAGQTAENASAPQIHVVLNWFDEVRARVPVP